MEWALHRLLKACLISEPLEVSSPGAKCQPEGKLGSLTQPRLEIHLNSKNYRCHGVAAYIHEFICSPTEHPPSPSTCQALRWATSERREQETPRVPLTLLARQHFSFWGRLFPHLPKASLDIHSFSDGRCMITISKQRACSLRPGGKGT